ncbi:hypothetical protein ACOSP7_015407 [Xanthoceras sorbifolium]
MCYPGAPFVGRRNLVAAVQGRWFLLQTSTAVEQLPTDQVAGRAGGGVPTKQCVCSPTTHPGSFRCRHHHAAEYVWGGGRITRNDSTP